MTEETTKEEHDKLVTDVLFKGHFAGGYFNKEGKFQPALLSIDIQKMLHIVTMKDNREIWIYDPEKGCYKANGAERLRVITKKILGTEYREKHAIATIDDITASTQIEREEFHHPSHLIPVQNGLIDLLTPEPYQLLEHDPIYYVTGVLPVDYDPNAECSVFNEFLEEILPEMTDRIKIQEGFGNSLNNSREYMIIYMLYGEGYNGKSTLMNVLNALLGNENVSNISLFNLAYGTWYTADLFGKLANIYADIGIKELKLTGSIKILTGDDVAKGERKYQKPFYFRNNAKPWFSTNVMPFVYDNSDAFHRRWRIIKFYKTFPLGAPQTEPGMIKKLTTKNELSGILNWALEGLKRLHKQKTFSLLKTVEERREEWQILSDPLSAFVHDKIGFAMEGYVTKEEFYQEYRKYCATRRLAVMSKDKVGKRLPTIIPNVGEIYKAVGDKQIRSWSGIYLKEDNEKTKDFRDS